QDANVRLKKDGVAQPVGAGQNADGAASPPRDVINPGLERSIRSAADVRILGANRDRHALVPVRFHPITEDGPWVGVLGEVIGPRKSCANRAGEKTSSGRQELSALKSPVVKGCHGVPFLENSICDRFVSGVLVS